MGAPVLQALPGKSTARAVRSRHTEPSTSTLAREEQHYDAVTRPRQKRHFTRNFCFFLATVLGGGVVVQIS